VDNPVDNFSAVIPGIGATRRVTCGNFDVLGALDILKARCLGAERKDRDSGISGDLWRERRAYSQALVDNFGGNYF
jgi:hypothetical protein